MSTVQGRDRSAKGQRATRFQLACPFLSPSIYQMAFQSSSGIMPLPSPSSSSVRSYYRLQHSVDSVSTSCTTSPPRYEPVNPTPFRPTIPSRCNTIDSCSQIIRDTSQYSRRQLSIEAVQCVFIDESDSSGTKYTFLVKPTLLQTGRSGARSKHNRKADEARISEQIARGDDDHDEDNEQQSEVEPYQVEKSSKELLELSNRLISSFDVLLDPRRGGPTPLSKDLLLPKWNVKDIFRRRKKSGSMQETQLAEATSVAKKDVVNDFFLKVLRTGGEVLSSCRAMQDFL